MASCTCGCGNTYADEATAAAFGADHKANETNAAELPDLEDEDYE